MPYLTLSLQDFRNLYNGRINLNAREVFFIGSNAQGKTALLESLYYCAYGSSFRTHNDSEVIKHGADSFALSALYAYDELTQRVDVTAFNTAKRAYSTPPLATQQSGAKGEASPNGNGESVSSGTYQRAKRQEAKRIEKNGKKVHDRKELIDTMSCVLFCHSDMRFATGTPEDRRFFLNQSLAMLDPLFLDDLRSYNKVLKSRNMLLKDKQYGMLDIYDVQMSSRGLEVQKKRQNAVFQFNQVFGQLYREISGIDGVTLLYRPSWKGSSTQEVMAQLASHREQDKIMGTSMCGPHRDRLEFLIGGKPFVPVASTGQLRLIALLLRVSQAVCASRATGKKSVLLMDDVMLELDTDKRRILTAMLPEYDQLFCTFLPDEPYQKYKKQSTMVYQIQGGQWTLEQ